MGSYSWTNPGAGDWIAATNWMPPAGSPGTYPGASDDATDAIGSSTIDIYATTVVNTVTIAAGATLNLLVAPSTLLIQDTLTVTLGTIDVAEFAYLSAGSTMNLVAGALNIEGPDAQVVAPTITLGANFVISGIGLLDGAGPAITTEISGTGTITAMDTSVAGGILNVSAVMDAGLHFAIASMSGLELDGPVAAGDVINFENTTITAGLGSGTLIVDEPIQGGTFQGTIENFIQGDTLVVQNNGGSAVAHAAYSTSTGAGVITFTDAVGDVLGAIASLTDPGMLSVTLVNGHYVTVATGIPCFLRGTMLLTPRGEVPVQTLRAGDEVTTLAGARKRIRWIGNGRTLLMPVNAERCAPVVVRRGALGDNVPHRDLYVTRGHSLFVEGYLIPVEELINHRSIAWAMDQRWAEYYHIELDDHDVLVADGAPAESYREDENDAQFHNAATRTSGRAMPPCAEILHSGPDLRRIWKMLSDRAGVAPVPITPDPDLHLRVDGKRLDAVSVAERVFRFALDATPANLRIVSRSAVPSALGIGQDQRRLGVAVHRIVLAKGRRKVTIWWDDDLTDGFNDPEPAEQYRWTRGDAGIPPHILARFKGGLTVDVHVGGLSGYALPQARIAAAA